MSERTVLLETDRVRVYKHSDRGYVCVDIKAPGDHDTWREAATLLPDEWGSLATAVGVHAVEQLAGAGGEGA